MNEQKNIMMIAASAVVLIAVNVGVFMAAGNGSIGPIDNMVLWGGFVVVNMASILWAVSLLGLQPLVVSVCYVAGGCLAFLGVRGMNDVSVAEITTAGATYGAFGALAIGNMTAKVRLAFFNKQQVPFIFIIVGLLVVDGLLNSQVSNAGGAVLLNAVFLPFVLAGVALGLVWTVLNRFGIGRKPSEVLAEKEAYIAANRNVKEDAVEEKLVFQVPSHAAVEEEAEVEAKPEPAKRVEVPEPVAPAAQAKPIVAEEPPAKPKKEEEFFPLEIDKGDAVTAYSDDEETLSNLVSLMEDDEAEEEFTMPTFDEDLYASGSHEAQSGGVLVKESKPEVKTEVEPAKPVVEKPPVVAEAKPEPKPEPKPEVTPAPKAEEAPAKEEKSDDWLGGHLDLLNKLK